MRPFRLENQDKVIAEINLEMINVYQDDRNEINSIAIEIDKICNRNIRFGRIALAMVVLRLGEKQ